MDNKKLVTTAMMIAIAVIMVITGNYIPPLFFVIFLVPVPIIIVTEKIDIEYGIIALFIISILTFLFTDIITAMVIGLINVMGIIMGYLISKRESAEDVVKNTGVITFLGFVLVLYILKLFKINVITSLLSTYTKLSNEIISLYGNSPNSKAVKSLVQSAINSIKITIPSLFVIMIILLVVVNYIVASKILIKEGENVSRLPAFQEWRMPYITGWIFIAVLIYQYFVTSNIVSTNIMILLTTGFAVSGLAFVQYYISKKLHIKTVFSTLILIILFLFPVTFSIMSLLGVIDTGMNLRKFFK